jgi:hypothetical protein
MSNQPNSPSDFLNDVLAKFNEARDAREYGEALVWANTAAILDPENERHDPTAPVNTALFQLVFDTALACENLVLKCGNATTTHGDLLAYGQEANDLLVARLTEEKSPEMARTLAVVVQGHFNNLFEQLDRHFDRDVTYTVTTGQEATLLRDTTATIRTLIAAQPSIKVKSDISLAERAVLLQICVESPDYLVAGFPVRFLSVWDKALFHIESAQAILAEMKASQGYTAKIEGSNGSAVTTALEAALTTAHALTSAKSKKAKASFKAITDLGRSLAAVFAQ